MTFRSPKLLILVVMADPTAIDFLGKILLDQDEAKGLREDAVWALGRTMDDRAFPYLKEALAGADDGLADRILVYLTEIRTDLSFSLLCESMERHGLPDKGADYKGDLGAAWLRLHYCSGYPDVIGQYKKDKSKLKEGMQEYWEGKRRMLALSRQLRDLRYGHINDKKENASWRELELLVKELPMRVLRGGIDLGIPDEFDGNSWQEFVSGDGTLRIRKTATADGFTIAVSPNGNPFQKEHGTNTGSEGSQAGADFNFTRGQRIVGRRVGVDPFGACWFCWALP